MQEEGALERLGKLEAERDALRARVASFERGEPELAYRTERASLEAQVAQLSAENDELDRRIKDMRKPSPSRLVGLTRALEDFLERSLGPRR